MFGSLINTSACKPIEEICTTFADGDWIESKDQSNAGIRLVQTGNIGTGVYLDKGERARFISEETFKRLACTEVFPGDILVSRLPDPIGRACILPDGLGKAVTAVDCCIIRLCQDVLPEFFVTYTLTPGYMAQINEAITGSTRQRISRKSLGKISIPVPDLALQMQFVHLVQETDKSKVELQKCISNIDGAARALMNTTLVKVY